MGYDFLAIRALVARGHISGVGRQIGVGKESDIFEVCVWRRGVRLFVCVCVCVPRGVGRGSVCGCAWWLQCA
jgi:hypothetical protein